MHTSDLERAVRLWRMGLDTSIIGDILNIPEHEVYNRLGTIRMLAAGKSIGADLNAMGVGVRSPAPGAQSTE